MKILLIKTYPSPIPQKNLSYNVQEFGIASALGHKGIECDLLCVTDTKKDYDKHLSVDGQNIIIYYRHAYSILKNAWFRNVKNLINTYDVLITGEYNQMFSWYLAGKYPQKTIIWHGTYYSEFNKNYNRMAAIFDLLFAKRYKKQETVFMTKSSLATNYLSTKGFKNIHTIGVGICPSLLINSSEKIPKELNDLTSYTGLKLLYIGVLEERRNILFLIDILIELHRRNIEFRQVIIGRYSSDSYRSMVQDKINMYGLSDKIIYIEKMEQRMLSSIYKICDIFLFPTRYDIFGMVLLEAMYFGLPVITTLNGGSAMLIRDDNNGFIVESSDVNAWVNKIVELSTNNDKCKMVGQNANTTIADSYTWDVLVEKMIKCFNIL